MVSSSPHFQSGRMAKKSSDHPFISESILAYTSHPKESTQHFSTKKSLKQYSSTSKVNSQTKGEFKTGVDVMRLTPIKPPFLPDFDRQLSNHPDDWGLAVPDSGHLDSGMRLGSVALAIDLHKTDSEPKRRDARELNGSEHHPLYSDPTEMGTRGRHLVNKPDLSDPMTKRQTVTTFSYETPLEPLTPLETELDLTTTNPDGCFL